MHFITATRHTEYTDVTNAIAHHAPLLTYCMVMCVFFSVFAMRCRRYNLWINQFFTFIFAARCYFCLNNTRSRPKQVTGSFIIIWLRLT